MNDFFTFLVLSLFVVMSPGIDTALITKRTISGGRNDGYKMAAGLSTGSLVHTFAAAFGISAILMQSAVAFEICWRNLLDIFRIIFFHHEERKGSYY